MPGGEQDMENGQDASIALQQLPSEDQWALRSSQRPTPAQHVRERREAFAAEFSNPSSTESTNRHGMRPSGSSVTTRRSRGSQTATAQHALLNYVPGMYSGGRSQRSPSSELAPHQKDRLLDEETLKQLRRYRAYKKGKLESWTGFLNLFPHRDSALQKPDDGQLMAIAKRTFPPRMSLPVLVCDILEESGNFFISNVGDIQKLWQEKPENALFRWIHAPLGVGYLHSSVEDIFRAFKPMGRQFKNAGSPGFPYLDGIDTLHFRDREELQHMRNVIHDLRPLEDLAKLLNDEVFAGDNNVDLKEDIDWRIRDHFGEDLDFWNLAKADFPYELSERIAYINDGPLSTENMGEVPLDGSVLATRVAQFQGAQLVVAPFRCFHREDGVLLTMSAASGVDALHKDFHAHVRDTLHGRLVNKNAWTVANQMATFREQGAQGWYEHTMEYFLVRLVTEIGAGPNNFADGLSAMSLGFAFQTAVQNLKRRRYDPWEEKTTLNLVKEHLTCIDQLKALSATYGRRITFFENLAKDLAAFKAEDQKEGRQSAPNNPEGDSSEERVEWALSCSRTHKSTTDLLLDDISRSLDTLHQLQTLHQNELQITSHRANKALAVITSVTVVFLPLGFFCSYFGMNFVDIRDTTRTQSYFWEVCGSLTGLIVLMVLFVAYRHRMLLEIYGRSAEVMRQRRERKRVGVGVGKVLP